MIAGRVIELWRYPVKSMLGERLERAVLGPAGIEGDRAFALRNLENGRVLSAKKYAKLLGARGRTVGPDVMIDLPSGDTLNAAAAAEPLSAWLGLAVEVARPSEGAERPVMEADDGTFRGRAGSFFDSSVVHLVTTSTLQRLSELHPAGRFDPRRFRPNVVLKTVEHGFVEETWVGETIRIGGALIEITKPCSRCVMTTHAQGDLPVDRDVLRVVRERNDEHVGVYGLVREAGTISLGDEALPA